MPPYFILALVVPQGAAGAAVLDGACRWQPQLVLVAAARWGRLL